MSDNTLPFLLPCQLVHYDNTPIKFCGNRLPSIVRPLSVHLPSCVKLFHIVSHMDVDAYQKFKVLIIGDSSVGKTSLLLRHTDQTFNQETVGTIGVDFKQKTYYRDRDRMHGTAGTKDRYDLFLWDTAGQERFRNVVSAYYRDAHAAFVVFDLTNRQSFDHVPYWVTSVREKVHDPILILIGNKNDLAQAKITQREIQDIVTQCNITSYIQTSAKDGTHVDRMFDLLLEKLIIKTKPAMQHNVIQLKSDDKKTVRDTKCC